MTTLTTKRIIKLGLTNFWRNRWLSAQATLVLAVTLIFVTVFLLGQMVLGLAVAAVREKIDVTVYFEDVVPDVTIKDLQAQLATRSDIKSIRYISKEEALEIWQGRPTSTKIKGLISAANNPLPRSLQVKTDDPAALEAVTTLFSGVQFQGKVRRVSYQETKTAIDKLLRITDFMKQFGFGLSIFFMIISVVVVLNTVRLALFTRREEIEVMRLVGASAAFARSPFLVEAALYSFIATLLALTAIAAAAWFSRSFFAISLGGSSFDIWLFFINKLAFLSAVCLGLSLLVALLSTIWETRRHLKF